MARRIAIVHHRRSFFALDLRREIGADLEPVWVLADELAEDAGLQRLMRRSGPVLPAPGLSLDELAARLRELEPEGIVTFVDDTLELTAALAARLELPYHSPAVAATLADKIRQRSALDRAGVPGPRFWGLEPELQGAALAARAREIDYPAVLKPAAGAGSRGLRALAGPDDLLAAHTPGTAALVEAQMDDPPGHDTWFAAYLSLESVVCEGAISHAATCGRFPLAHPFRETGNFIPAEIGPEQTEQLVALTEAAIRALGIQTGVMHTEIKLTSDGPKVIEVNGRLGGRPPFVLRDVSDVNLFRAACDLALGETVSIPGPVQTSGVGFWWMLQPPQDAVSVGAVHGLERVAQLPGVESVSLDRHPGDPVDWREGTAGQLITARGRVRDHASLAAMIRAITDTFGVEWVRAPAGASAALVRG